MPIDALMELVQQIVAFHMKVEPLKLLLDLNFLSQGFVIFLGIPLKI